MEALKDASTVQPAQTSGKNLLLFVISTFWLAKPICKPGSAAITPRSDEIQAMLGGRAFLPAAG